MTAVLDQPPIPSVDQHPAVLEFRRDLASTQQQLAAAQSERARLVVEREALADRSVATLISFGKLQPADVETRAARLDEQITKARAEVERLEVAVRQLEIDGRGIREQAASEIRRHLRDEAQEILSDIGEHYSQVQNLAVRLEMLRQRGVKVPATLALVTEYMKKARVEARQLGFTID